MPQDPTPAVFVLANDRLALALRSSTKGGLATLVDPVTLRDALSPSAHPLFRMSLREPGGRQLELASADAAEHSVVRSGSENEPGLTLRWQRLGGLDLDAEARVRLPAGSPLSFWSIGIRNRTSFGVRSLVFPVVVTRAKLDPAEEDWLIEPSGRLLVNPSRHTLPVRDADEWMPIRQYPGSSPVQFTGQYDRIGGVYVAACDGTGSVKDVGAFRLADGLDLSIAHHFDERPGIDFALPYETVVGVFHGDWYDAAEIYRAWARGQSWCRRTLAERDDIPAWVTEPYPELMTISQGGQERIHGLQTTPGEYPIGRFWPARKAVALQKEYSRILGSRILSWMEGWEKIGAPGGPVEIFPPREGAESYRAAMDDLVADGHVPIMYLAGFHWCHKRSAVGYDDWPRFEREGRPMAAIWRDGSLMLSNNHTHLYAMGQKHYVQLCTASADMRKLFLANFDRMMDIGAIGVQLDQVAGMVAQVCYSAEHGHPPGYGPWMTEATRAFIREVRGRAKRRDARSIFRCECPCEYWIDEMDAFLDRPYHYEGQAVIIPLFQYLYHEYVASYSGDGIVNLLHPDASLMLHARVFTIGLRHTVAYGEEEYNVEVDPNYPVLGLLANLVKAERTWARPYVVLGRMQRPVAAEVAHVRVDGFRGEPWEADVPKVYHGSWRAGDGSVGHVFANWTGAPERVTLRLAGRASGLRVVDNAASRDVGRGEVRDGALTVEVPARDALGVIQPPA